jgi:PAS domain S-box-containing protein
MTPEESTQKKSSRAKSKRPGGKKGLAPVLNPHLNVKSEPIDTTAADVNKTLAGALAESHRRQAQMSGLLRASRAVLEYHDFNVAARTIFDAAKELTGATAGYVALLAPDGTENEVLFLDSGGHPCSVDPSLPMPIRGLRAEAYRTGKAVFDNDFATSRWMKFMPAGHSPLHCVMFAPLVLDGKVAGLLGLANKPGGFVAEDAQLATGLGELAAIALKNSRMLEALETSERRFRTLMETASDAIVCADGSGSIILWNQAAENIFGYSTEEVTGKALDIIMPEPRRGEHNDAIRNLVSGGRPKMPGKTIELVGLRKNGEEFPIELSLASWGGTEDLFFTGIIRDITDRKKSEAQITALAKFPSEDPNPVLRIAIDGEIMYHNEAAAPLLEAWGCLDGQPLSGKWLGFVIDTLKTKSWMRTELECKGKVFLLTFAGVFDFGYTNIYALDITEHKRIDEELRTAHNELETRVQQRTESLAITINQLQEEVRERRKLETEVLRIGELERQRIGQDLHDSLGQMLGGISFLSRVLHGRLSTKNIPEASDAAEIETIAMDSIKLTRSLAKGLNPLAQRPDSLMIAMKDLAWNTENMFAIRCIFECEEPVLVDDYIVAAHTYRIAQEAVANAVRHGKAGNIRILLTRPDDGILMTIKDDGVGLPDEIPESSGIGFRTMRYRAESIQASLKIELNPDGGTIVSCHIPVRSTQ